MILLGLVDQGKKSVFATRRTSCITVSSSPPIIATRHSENPSHPPERTTSCCLSAANQKPRFAFVSHLLMCHAMDECRTATGSILCRSIYNDEYSTEKPLPKEECRTVLSPSCTFSDSRFHFGYAPGMRSFRAKSVEGDGL